MTTPTLEELEALAKAATQGRRDGRLEAWWPGHGEALRDARAASDEDCAFIAAMNPHVVLSLIARLREAERFARAVEWRNNCCPVCGMAKRTGHAPDCALAAWLKGAGGAP